MTSSDIFTVIKPFSFLCLYLPTLIPNKSPPHILFSHVPLQITYTLLSILLLYCSHKHSGSFYFFFSAVILGYIFTSEDFKLGSTMLAPEMFA